MAKRRLNNGHRKVILNWMLKEKNAAPSDSKAVVDALNSAITVANKAIRDKYPEKDMVVLRKYGAARKDRCLKFTVDGSYVFGLEMKSWNIGQALCELAEDKIFDLPYSGGCYSSVVFQVDEDGRAVIEKFASVYKEVEKEYDSRSNKYDAFVTSAKYLEDIEQVIPLPEDIRQRITGANDFLVHINPEIIDSIAEEFKAA